VAAAASALVSISGEQEIVVSETMGRRLSDPQTQVVADAAAVLARIAKGTNNDKTRQEIVAAFAKNLSGRLAGGDELSGRVAGAECKRIWVRALGDIGPAAKTVAPLLGKMVADPAVSKEVADAWQKILPGTPLPTPKIGDDMELRTE
jgi:hypothetical protein